MNRSLTRRIPATQNKQSLFFGILLALTFLFGSTSHADDASALDIKVDTALANFISEVDAANTLLESAAAALVFPTVVQQGFGNDSEYGEGALRIGGKSVAYYETHAESFGLQLGAQKKTVILLFTNKNALTEFREKDSWVAGEDGTIDIHKPPTSDNESDEPIAPIICFVIDSAGLMYNVSLEGSRFTKISKQASP